MPTHPATSLIILGIAFLAVTVSPGQPAPKTLIMHYMPWYETPVRDGKWGKHWTGPKKEHDPAQANARGLPDLYSHYHPLIGPYDSTDPDLIECHLLQMKLAGVDGVIVDWYGIADMADYPSVHRAAEAVFAGTARFDMKFAACYEDRSIKLAVDWNKLPAEQAGQALTDTLQWMQTNWFSKPNYLHKDGRPLLLNFGPIYIKDPAMWQSAFDPLPKRPAFFSLHHLWRKVGADGGFTWKYDAPWDGPQDEKTVHARVQETFAYVSDDPAKVIPSALPGFKDIYTKQHFKPLPHREGRTLRETLSAAMDGPWPMIQLMTWNDYGEGTMIEPTHEFGYTFLEIIQQVRRNEQGEAFVYTANDLRLPIQLYRLRKTGEANPALLDRISELLDTGKCQQARALLKSS